jgi:chaperonin GroEL
MPKQLMFDDEARRKILKGVQQIVDAMKITLGPTGKNVIIEKQWGSPQATRDGVTVSKEVDLPDPFENMGAKMVNEVASKTGDEAGDGTTTAAILAGAIYEEGLKYVTAGANPVALKRGMDAAVAVVVEQLKKSARPVSKTVDFLNVAVISTNNDAELGKLIAEAMEKVGKEGVITVEEGKVRETKLEFAQGLEFEKGYVSPYFVTKLEDLSCEYTDCLVLCYEKKIASIAEIVPLLEKVVHSGRPLVIIAEEIEGEALATMVVNRLGGGLRVVAVKAPAFGDRRKAMLEDIAVITGGKFISEESGMKLENVTVKDLGSAGRVRVEKDKTQIVDGGGGKAKIETRLAQIRAQMKQTTSDYDREKLQERLARIQGGVAVIRAGGATEAEMKEKKARIDDGVHAAKAAREEGIVIGGGVALLHCLPKVNELHLHGDEQLGARVIAKALMAPAAQLAENTGNRGTVVVQDIIDKGGDMGYDARTDGFVDMFDKGIIDPVKVTRLALQNASSVMGLLLTSRVIITDLKKKDEKRQLEGVVR